MKKKGNAAAVLIIIMLIILSLSVLLYDPYIEQEFPLEYEKLYTQAVSSVERSYFHEYQLSMRDGFDIHGGSWYFNAGYNLSEDEVVENIRNFLSRSLEDRLYVENGVEVSIRNLENNLNVTLTNDFIQINISGALVEVSSADERRIINLDDSFSIPSDLRQKIIDFNTWLGCDAGNLTNNFKDFYQSITCQFSDCCCANMGENYIANQFPNLVSTHGVKKQDVSNILNESVHLLNQILNSHGECSNAAGLAGPGPFSYECKIDEESLENLYIEHFYNMEIDETSDCNQTEAAEPDCVLIPDTNPNNNPQMISWNRTELGVESIDFSGRNESNRLHPLFSDLHITNSNLRNEFNEIAPGDGNVLHALAINNAVGGEILIDCRNTEDSNDYERISFKIKLRHYHACSPPLDSFGVEELICSPENETNGDGNGDDDNGNGIECPACEIPNAAETECIPTPNIPCDFGTVCQVGICEETADGRGICVLDFERPDGFDCGDTTSVCTDRQCSGGVCTIVDVNDGAACDISNPCYDGICDGGNCDRVVIHEGASCGNTGLFCAKRECNAEGNCVTVTDFGKPCGSGDCIGVCEEQGGLRVCSSRNDPCSGNVGACTYDNTCTNQGRCNNPYTGKSCCSGVWCDNDCCNNICCEGGADCCNGACCLAGKRCCDPPGYCHPIGLDCPVIG